MFSNLNHRSVRFAVAVFWTVLTLGTGTALAQGEATYEITFATTWTSATHPTEYPPSPHFSGLIGGTHDADVQFWAEGEMASLGIQRMAEWGNQAELSAEIQDAIDAGDAHAIMAGSSLWDVPGSTSLPFTTPSQFSLVTVVSMIAPSPDWFVGVRNLDLRPGGQWAQQIVVDLYPWDAGTDSGVTYTSGDVVTNPHVPIFAIIGGPMTPGVPLGTFTFTLQSVSDVPTAAAFEARAYPNPFNPRTTIAWEMPTPGTLRVTIHDAAGRLVRELWNGTTEAGPGRIEWDGRDSGGRTVAAGSYVYRLSGAGGRAAGRLTLVK